MSDFWSEKHIWLQNGDMTEDNEMVARIGGYHYVLGDGKHLLKGSGGRNHYIKFTSGPHAGKEVTCNDLWQQGKIDSEWLDRLPDNAVWNHVLIY